MTSYSSLPKSTLPSRADTTFRYYVHHQAAVAVSCLPWEAQPCPSCCCSPFTWIQGHGPRGRQGHRLEDTWVLNDLREESLCKM